MGIVWLRFFRSLTILSGIGIAFICISVAQGPPENSSWLTPGKLTNVGLHLPSDMPTVANQIPHQAGLPTDQEFSIQWNSLPSVASSVVKKQDVQNIPISPNFVILSRKHSLDGGTRTRAPMLVNDELVVAAATPGGEIRGLLIIWDPRASFTEDVARGKKTDLVQPNATFTLSIPDDAQIKKIVFLQPVSAPGGGAILNFIGEIPLSDNRITREP